jgi:DNA-directed RNA polymerase subunit RPC12/RpoP
VCHQCGSVLYEGEELKPPDEILQKNDGKCPNCGRKLALIPINVEVKPLK